MENRNSLKNKGFTLKEIETIADASNLLQSIAIFKVQKLVIDFITYNNKYNKIKISMSQGSNDFLFDFEINGKVICIDVLEAML